jgi:hypothetical protein
LVSAFPAETMIELLAKYRLPGFGKMIGECGHIDIRAAYYRNSGFLSHYSLSFAAAKYNSSNLE